MKNKDGLPHPGVEGKKGQKRKWMRRTSSAVRLTEPGKGGSGKAVVCKKTKLPTLLKVKRDNQKTLNRL